MHRRQFIQNSAIFTASTLLAIDLHGWYARTNAQTPNSNRLIVIFLRGGVDGLSVVVPYRETAYYEARPRIAIPQPNQPGGVLDLDGRFGLHPALSDLMPLWHQKQLAFVHACGSPDSTRSHFDAQDYMESGTPGIKSTRDGWMNRLLAILAGHNPVQAVNVGATTPRILSGKVPIATLASGRAANTPLALDKPEITHAFDRLYNRNDPLSSAYKEAKEARKALMNDLDTEMKMANNGAPLPTGFARDAQQLARIMVRDPRVELAFMSLGGWDTHVNQGASQGQLARNLQQLGKGLTALQQGLGSAFANTTILVLSEFGRTVKENGNNGTDHGHGNVMWVLGGATRGGHVYGKWSGLSPDQLHDGRDLQITTDFRDVVAGVLERQMNLNDTKLHQIFPGFTRSQKIAVV